MRLTERAKSNQEIQFNHKSKDNSSIMRILAAVKVDNGIFHKENKYKKTTGSWVATIILFFVIVPVVILNVRELGSEININSYYEINDEVKDKIDMIDPPDSYFN